MRKVISVAPLAFFIAFTLTAVLASGRAEDTERSSQTDGGSFDAALAAAVPIPAKSASEEAKPGEEEKRITEKDLNLVENKTTYLEAVARLSKLSVKNIKVHTGEGNDGHVISGDGLEFLLVFGLFGYSGKIDVSEHLVHGASPKNYAVKLTKNGLILVTAEEFVLSFPNGIIKFVFLVCTMDGQVAVANMYEIPTVRIRENGGFFSPRFYESMEGDMIFLHAKDETGKDWPEAYALSGETGGPQGWVKWDDVKLQVIR